MEATESEKKTKKYMPANNVNVFRNLTNKVTSLCISDKRGMSVSLLSEYLL